MELLLAMKEPFVCHFLRGTYIKKNDRPLLFRLVCSPPVGAPLESGSAGGGGAVRAGGQKWNRASHPVGSGAGAHFRPKGPDPELTVRLSERPGRRHKTTAGHQHCNFLTYNKAISYFLPYK